MPKNTCPDCGRELISEEGYELHIINHTLTSILIAIRKTLVK